jgi:uncharacterized membrane protein (GlpM family)
MDIVRTGIAGGLVTAAIVFLSRRGIMLPGILPLFPTFALIALLIVGAKGDDSGFREACLAGARTIPAYLAFWRSAISRSIGWTTGSPCSAGRPPGLSSPWASSSRPPDLTTIRIAEFGRHFAVACAGAKR